ncbi:MAG: ABC transporter ATP-binding protein [Thermoplasmata archaeon]|nr:ABC transporter ATP-binding protein [Thermoplasmata archaeon]
MNDHAIEVTNLTKSYLNGYTALGGISFNVRQGEIVGYLGPNGAGKTTTIKILTNLLVPTSGKAMVNGINVAKDPKTAMGYVGTLVEVPGIYEYFTPREVLTYFGRVHGMKKAEIAPRISEVLHLLQIGEWENKKLGSFSTGMQRRFAIAKAILHNPDILIMDEPVMGLDPKGIKHIRDLIKQFQKDGMTIFLSSHLLSEVAETCDKVIFLDKGKIVEQDTVKNIMNKMDIKIIDVEFVNRPTDEQLAKINSIPLVEKVERKKGSIRLSFDGAPRTSADILKQLISNGYEIVSYQPTQVNLEDFYLSIMGDEKGVV